ncbi:hypothetical protein F5141DRAFT_1221119 [Pisolithus sp. B1]|nr:hypothetical protein F5141DRAFT_1221119 [Pisolithus sp. B1]
MDLPELAEDGCNWQTYSSWVLKAISEDGLMGDLDGSETRPTTPKLLQEYGAGWTPRTNEERDVITAWKTADDAWHQRATMAHQFIIYGLPDSILMLCMHLDTPREAFAYLEYRYGQIPRPEIQKTVDEAVQQHDMPSEQYMTGESAQSTCDSDNGPENLPGGHEDPADSPNDCAETKSRYLTPETEVVDARHVEPYLLEVEVGDTGGMWLDECTNALKAPDECSQRESNKVKEDEDLPQMSSEALETRGDLPFTTCKRAETQTGHRKPKNEVVDTQQVVDVLPMFEVGSTGQAWYDKHVKELEASDEGDNISRQAGGHSIESGPQIPSEDDQCTQTNGEMIANVPDPPSTHSEPSTLQIERPTLLNRSSARKRSAMTTEFDLSYTRTSDKLREAKCLELDSERASRCPQRTHQGHSTCETPPDEVWGMGVHMPARAGLGDSTDVRLTATRLEIRDISMQTAQALPNLPHWDMTRKEPDKAESASGGGDDTASKDFVDSRRVEKMLLANSRSQKGELRARQQNSLPVPPPTGTYYGHKSSKGLRCHARFKSNAENESQQAERSMAGKEDASGRGRDDASTSGYADSHGVKESPLTDGGGQYSEYEAKRPRRSPAPPAPSPNGIMDMPTPFMNLRRCGRFERMAENVSNTRTRQGAYHARAALMQPLTPLIAPSKRFLDPVGGLWTMNLGYNEVRRVRRVKTRGHMHWTACILMRLLRSFLVPLKRL